MSTTVTRDAIDDWAAELDQVHARLGPRFVRSEPRRRVRRLVDRARAVDDFPCATKLYVVVPGRVLHIADVVVPPVLVTVNVLSVTDVGACRP